MSQWTHINGSIRFDSIAGLSEKLNFDEKKDAWIVNLKHGKHELSTHLDRKDAEACLEGTHCVYLGVQVGQFVENFEEAE